MAFCNKYKGAIKKITKTIDGVLNDAIGIGHSITTAIGSVMNDPNAQFLLSFIPEGTDKEKVMGIISKVITETNDISVCSNLEGVAKITCLLKAVNAMPEIKKNNTLLNVNSAIVKELDGGRYKTVFYDVVANGNHLTEVMEAGKEISAA